ncbi:MAG: group II intron reverse transcriptase/maturase [Chloroflexi bacterium]|nr:group II intron reverse transcriptase/maturase [Chloroflexota bacterium]
MQKAEVILSLLSRKAACNHGYVFERLYRNLFNPDFYLLAYSNIYANEGNMTVGTDGETIDGFNLERVNRVIAQLKQETYRPNPVRRTYIPKKNGKRRPLGIPSFTDKLVQEVVRMLLEAIYDPVFKDTSHGFRPGRSCHTALMQVKTTCKGTNWVIEGDIQGFFDNINHAKLLQLLAHKITDGRFLNLIDKFLKAGYMEFRQVHPSLTGTPQGGIVSPILANIYLHELDVFMEGLCQRYFTSGIRRKSADYQTLNLARFHARRNGDYAQAEALLQHMRTLHASDPLDPNYIKVKYCRYADDFMVMIIGSKQLAEHIREDIRAFLETLSLVLSPEKTLITNLSDRRVRFLGYEIAKTHEDTKLTPNAHGVKKRAANGTIQLLVPADVVREKLKPFVSNGKAIHHNARVNAPLLDILTTYNAEIRGLYNFYCLATDVSTKLGKFKFFHYYSLLKTVARKEKCSVAQVINRYGVDVQRKQQMGTRKVFGVRYSTQKGDKTLTYFNEPLRKKLQPQAGLTAQEVIPVTYPLRHRILDRLNANHCELCGYQSNSPSEFEVHHVRKLRDIKQKYQKRGQHIPNWVLAMASLNRKTLVVCKSCHRAIHSGQNTHPFKGSQP